MFKKIAAGKRASVPRTAEYTGSFLKDLQRTHSGRHDIGQFREAILFIANDALLGPEWLDYALRGDWLNHRKCRNGRDFLLIYQVEGRLQAPAKKSVKTFTADTLTCHRYAGHGYRTRKGLEARAFLSWRMGNSKAKT